MKFNYIVYAMLLPVITVCVCSAQTRMQRSVLSAGAARSSGPAHILSGTIGQPVTGAPKNASHQGSFGFWYGRGSIATGVDRIASAAPSSIVLEQNFPNPAITSTVISFTIPVARRVLLVVTDAQGRTLQRVADGMLDAGSYKSEIQVDDLPAGTYFYRLHAGGEQRTRKFIVLR